MATCDHCGDEYSAWNDEEYVFHNGTTGNVPHCVGIKNTRLDSARELLFRWNAFSYDVAELGIDSEVFADTRSWLAEDGEECAKDGGEK